jgi:hypothetical protein
MGDIRAGVLDDSAVRDRLESIWPEIVAWNERLALPSRALPGSTLYDDDQHGPDEMWVSHLCRYSLGTGSQSLLSTARYHSGVLAVHAPDRYLGRRASRVAVVP